MAAVDVFEEEPVRDAAHPLLNVPNVVATPHLGYVTHEEYETQFGEIFDQILAYAASEPTNVINPGVLGTPSATDADTGRIVASALTDEEADDGSRTARLLGQVGGPVASSIADGAFASPTTRSTATTSTPRSRRGTPTRMSSCRRARARFRATRSRPRRRGVIATYDASPSAVGWVGSGRRGATGVPWWSPKSPDGSASSATGCARRRTGARRPRWRSPPAS
jgi:hypothetical protein